MYASIRRILEFVRLLINTNQKIRIVFIFSGI